MPTAGTFEQEITMTLTRFPNAVVVSTCILAVSAAHAQVSFHRLVAPPSSRVIAVSSASADGSVLVGSIVTDTGSGPLQQAFRWTSQSGTVGLGSLAGFGPGSQAIDVTADGQRVIGYGSNGTVRPFEWTASTGMLPITGVSPTSGLGGISGDGLYIVGTGATSPSEAYRRDPAGNIQSLGFLQGGTVSGATATNGDGSVVAGVSAIPNSFLSFRWSTATGMVPLGDIPGGGNYNQALSISTDGSTIVGVAALASAGERAYRWTESTGMQLLGALPGVGRALDASGDGSVVVGYYQGRTKAFIWTPALGQVDLKSYLISQGATGLADFDMREASCISADGRVIAGFGFNSSGVTEGWYAVIPAPSTLAVLPLMGLYAARRRR
jgi:uncharacterized membrane protein